MKQVLSFAAAFVIVASLCVGCSGDEYEFVGDPGLEPGFPVTGGSGGGGTNNIYIPTPPANPTNMTFVLSFTTSNAVIQHVDMFVMEPGGFNLGSTPPGGLNLSSPSGGEVSHSTGGFAGNAGGPFRATWSPRPPSGTYTYGLRWFDGSGSIDWTFLVYLDDFLLSTHTGTMADPDPMNMAAPEGPHFTVGTVTFP